MSTSITGAIAASTTTGLGNGIDVQQFVNLATAGAQANITNLQNEQTTLNAQTTALQQITTDLTNLQNAEQALSDPLGALDAQSATSSNTSVVSATANSTAASGVHSVVVNSLATTSSYYTDPVASSSTPLATGSFTIQVGSNAPTTINITSTNNTLDELAATINGQDDGVTASVINDANGSRLALVSNTSGAPGDLTVTNSTATPTGLTFNKAVQGLNASLVVDGIPISSTSNNVTGAINGVTLSLGSPSATAVSVSVNPDTSQATTAINTFVSAYNTAITDINSQFAVNASGQATGALGADGSLQQAQQSLLNAIAYSTSGNGAVSNLASIGVNLNDDGTLSVDNGTLSAALAGNFSDVQNFLQATGTGFASNLDTTLNDLIQPSTGVLGLDAAGIAQSSSDLSSQISDLQAQLVIQQQTLTQTYAQVNTTLQELPLLQSQLSQQLASA